jgi:hypothetical protein
VCTISCLLLCLSIPFRSHHCFFSSKNRCECSRPRRSYPNCVHLFSSLLQIFAPNSLYEGCAWNWFEYLLDPFFTFFNSSYFVFYFIVKKSLAKPKTIFSHTTQWRAIARGTSRRTKTATNTAVETFSLRRGHKCPPTRLCPAPVIKPHQHLRREQRKDKPKRERENDCIHIYLIFF